MWRWILAVLFIFSFNLGVGLITIPFSVSLAGFWPSVIATLISWVYLLFTGLYYLEATLANPPYSNAATFSRRYTGLTGTWITAFFFLSVNLSYLIFYFYLVGPIVSEMLASFGYTVSSDLILVITALLLASIVGLGFRLTILLNFVLTLAILIVFFFSLTEGFHASSYQYVKKSQWGFLLIIFPTLVSTLYFNTLIPTLAPFLKYDKTKLRNAIITALFMIGVVFMLWLYISIGSASGSDKALSKLNPLEIDFANLISVPVFGRKLPLMLCLNIIATALGVSTILVDFIFDLTAGKLGRYNKWKRFAIALVVFSVPWLLNISPSKVIYTITTIMTSVGSLYLAGLLPVLCAWSLRYFYRDPAPKLVPGGKNMMLILSVCACFFFYLVGLQLFYQGTFT